VILRDAVSSLISVELGVFNTSENWAKSIFTDLVLLPAGGTVFNTNGPRHMH